jgi:ABC-type transport system involved in cytochrome bd biosynthesis fused ATPase/permease subunit
MDEPTANLDLETEKNILESLFSFINPTWQKLPRELLKIGL